MQSPTADLRSQKNDANVQSIQIMRGIASILVVLLHTSIKWKQFGNNAFKEIHVGGSGVDLFFIISGYIMCFSTDGRQLNFIRFMGLRIRRIMPFYWLTTTIGLAIFLYNPSLVNSSGGETSIWASYVLFPTGAKYLNANGWTLSFEFFFYLIFAVFIYRGTDKAMRYSSIILLILVALSPFFIMDGFALNFLTNNMYFEFVLGMGCFYLFNRKGLRFASGYGIALCLTAVLLLVAEGLAYVPEIQAWRGFCWGIPMLFLFAGLLSMEGPIRRASSSVKTIFLGIGDSSYSLYLIHPFALSGLARLLKHFNAVSNPTFFVVALLIPTIVLGHLAFLYIRKTTDRLRQERDDPQNAGR
ncbi:acyltransferase family protein [Puia sp. P3]|uniref:acyltransferase family protein n=1 Tax=Puia sp. P3 TaxID=3423952 RepID=UPI003D66A679